jgi:Domain of unknown function (DUF4260)
LVFSYFNAPVGFALFSACVQRSINIFETQAISVLSGSPLEAYPKLAASVAWFSLDNSFAPLLIRHFMLTSPKWLLRLEGLLVLAVAIIAYRELGDSWLKFCVLFLVPDIFMAGYFFGTRAGTAVYNVGHTYAAPFLLWLVDYFVHVPSILFICTIWVAHIGFDRLLGYGLKYPTAFKDTHLGKV